MSELNAAAQRTIARQHGAISKPQLRRAGVGPKTIRRLIERGVLVGVHKGVYRAGTALTTLEQRVALLCLAHPSAFVTGPTAGSLIGLRRMPRRSAITMSSRHPLHVTNRGVAFRRSTKVADSDVVQRKDGIRIASLTRLAFDLAANVRDRDHRSVVDQLIHEHGVSPTDLLVVGNRLHHPTRPGSDRFLRTISSLSDTPVESDAELRVADALHSRDVPVITNGDVLDLPNGRGARLDLSVAEFRWAVEVDVHPSHLGLVGATNDRERDRQSRLLGWQIERITALDLDDLDRIADELAVLYHQRRTELGAA